jgi:putative ABC transport system permease protein
VENFANISYISVNESFQAIKSLLNLLIVIINSIAFLTLFSGIIVLLGILNVSKKDKLFEVAIFKILGASPKKIIFLWLQEYFIIGIMTSLISFVIGTSVSYLLLKYVFQIEFYFNFLTISLLSLFVPAIIIIISFLKMFTIMYLKPLKIIRINNH